MTRYHATSNGKVSFTEEEELEWDDRKIAHDAEKIIKDAEKQADIDKIAAIAQAQTDLKEKGLSVEERLTLIETIIQDL